MKKLLFLLLVMALGAGIVFAMTPDDPPGVFNPETIMAEYSVQQGVATQPAVLVMEMPTMADLSSFEAVLANDYIIAIQPHDGFISEITVSYRTRTSSADYHLLL